MEFPQLSSRAILAPMAGVTDVAFRTLCRRYGAALTYTEFVSSAALVRESEKTRRLLVTSPEEEPVGVQLFGADEEEIVAAAKMVAPAFDIIDLNCGCPAWKVIKTGAGSALLNNPEKIARLVKKVVEAVEKPVTVKIRAGVDREHLNAVEVALAAEKAGAAAITVHGRTQEEGFRGVADWGVVKKVKEAVKIPVIGNGDVFSAKDFLEKQAFCDYIMIGRGAIGNPAIFAEIRGEPVKKSKLVLFEEYLALAEEYGVPFVQVKTQALFFTKGVRGGSRLREVLTRTKNTEMLKRILETWEV